MNKYKVVLAMLLASSSYGMDIDRTISDPSEPQALSTLEQLPMELKTRIVESVLSSNNLSQALKSISALARTSKAFAGLLSDSKVRTELAKKLINLPGTIKQKMLVGTSLGVANQLWYVSYMNSVITKFNKEFLNALQSLNMNYQGPLAASALKNLRYIAQQNILLDVTSVDALEIFLAAIYNKNEKLITLFLDAGFNVNMEKSGRTTPLLEAVPYPLVLEMLLKAGANPNGSNPNITSPLIRAALIRNTSSVLLLLDAGADIFVKRSEHYVYGDRKYNALQAVEHIQKEFPKDANNYIATIELLKTRMKDAFKERFMRAKQNYKPSNQIAANALQAFEESFNNSDTINANNDNGYILFLDAIAQDNDELAKLLIDGNLDVNAKMSTPFATALEYLGKTALDLNQK